VFRADTATSRQAGTFDVETGQDVALKADSLMPKIWDRARIKTYGLIAIVAFFGPLGNVVVGKGMKSVGRITNWAPGALFDFFWHAFASPTIWLGISASLTSFVAFILILSWADYSFVQPVASVSYAVVALLSICLIHEVIKPLQWAGVTVICLGVSIVGATAPRTTNRDE
jgi:drug/metabolite transporter (DMT)-like permease